jgi:hypothetical protein
MWIVCFPITWLGVGWEPGPPPTVWALSHLFKLPFWGLTLRHRNAVTWTCDWHDWFSLIFIVIVIIPSFCYNQEFRVSYLSFLSVVLFLCQATFCPFSVRQRAAFSCPFLSKCVVRVALLFGLLTHCLAASTTVSLEWQSDSPTALSFETLGLHWASALPDQPPLPDHLENHLNWVDSITMISLAFCRMSFERLVRTRKFRKYSRYSLQLWI